MSIVSEFREFALKGNVVDLAVGVVIGVAFGGVVKSLVDDILMPPLGKLMGNLDFSNMYLSLSDKIDTANSTIASTQPAGDGLSGVTSFVHATTRLPLARARELGPVIAYGNFITVLINFMIVAFAIFMVVKLMNVAKRRFERQQAAAAASPAVPTREQELLMEIRDVLKSSR